MRRICPIELNYTFINALSGCEHMFTDIGLELPIFFLLDNTESTHLLTTFCNFFIIKTLEKIMIHVGKMNPSKMRIQLYDAPTKDDVDQFGQQLK